MDDADVVVVKKPCGCVCMLCVTAYIDQDFRNEMSEAIAEGCTAVHMTASESRKQEFGCKHEPKQAKLI
jgi:hypothetical protein